MSDTTRSSSKGSSRSRFSNRARWDPNRQCQRARPKSDHDSSQARPEPDHHGSQGHPRPQPGMAGLKDEINRGNESYNANKPETREPILSQTQLANLWTALCGPPLLVLKILSGVVWNLCAFAWSILCCVSWINASPCTITLLTVVASMLSFLGIGSWWFSLDTSISLGAYFSVDWLYGSKSDPQSQELPVQSNRRILIFDPPRPGGVLEGLSSQSYILRQAYWSTVTLPANVSADLDRIATEMHLSQSRFTKMVKGYEQCHRNFRHNDLQFTYQVFDHNETLADYEDRRDTGSEVTWSWFGWLAGEKRWHPREILDIACSLTKSIPSQQQKLNATITCLRSALEDMEAISILLSDPEHDLGAIKNLAPGGITERVSGIQSNLFMTIKILATARKELQKESEMLKDKIHELRRQFTSISNKSADLERVMKAGEVDDSSQRELKTEMERMCQHVVEKIQKN